MWSPFAPVPNSQGSQHFPSCVSLCDCVSHGLSSAPGSCQQKAGAEVVPRDACETEPHSPSHRYRRQPTKLCSHLRPNTQLVLVGGGVLKVKTWLPEWRSREESSCHSKMFMEEGGGLVYCDQKIFPPWSADCGTIANRASS